jgi:hypothetical protein
MKTKNPTYIITTIVLSLIAIAFAIAPFLLRFHFCADDYQLISAALLDAFPILKDFGGTTTGFLYRPMVSLSLAFNFLISGWHPWSYLLSNVLVHTFNAYLCSRLVSRLILSDVKFDFFAALIFFLLPQGLMNVFWISGRTDLLCFTGAVGALLFADRYARDGAINALIGAASCFVFAIMCKEAALLIFIYLAAFFVFSPTTSSKKLYRKNLWHIIFIVGFLTAVYFFIRISAFGVFIGNQTSDEPMNFQRMNAWIAHGALSIFAPFDPIDAASISLAYPLLFFLIVISVVGFFTALTISIWLLENTRRTQIFFLLFASVFSLGIYFRSFPQARLCYLIVPFAISAARLAFSTTWHRTRTFRTGLILYFSAVLAFSCILVVKFRTIGILERSAEQAVSADYTATDTLLVVAQIGRIGQAWVETSMSVKFSPSRISASSQEPPPSIVSLGTFEGSILTDWNEPYTIRLHSDTLYLESSDPLSGFVPKTSRKFHSVEPIQNFGVIQIPITFSSLHKGVAHSIMIYPVSGGERTKVIFYQQGQFEQVSFKNFQHRFLKSTLFPNADSAK